MCLPRPEGWAKSFVSTEPASKVGWPEIPESIADIEDPMSTARLGRMSTAIASGMSKIKFGPLTNEESKMWDGLVVDIAQMDGEGYGIDIPSDWEMYIPPESWRVGLGWPAEVGGSADD